VYRRQQREVWRPLPTLTRLRLRSSVLWTGIESPHTQAQPKGLGQPCRASQRGQWLIASSPPTRAILADSPQALCADDDADTRRAAAREGERGGSRGVPGNIHTVVVPCVALRPSNSRQNGLPISVFCFRGSRQRDRPQSTSLPCPRRRPSSITCTSPCFTLPSFRPAFSLPSRRTRKTRFCRERDAHTVPTCRHVENSPFCRACTRHVGESSMAAAAIRRSSSIAALHCYHEAPAGWPPFSSGPILLRRMVMASQHKMSSNTSEGNRTTTRGLRDDRCPS